MTNDNQKLDNVAPDALGNGRIVVHNAVQIAALAALANLQPRPDYSHTALQWDTDIGGFQTENIHSQNGPVRIRVTLTPLTMSVVHDGDPTVAQKLDDVAETDCIAWLDAALVGYGLHTASSVRHPFKLPSDVVALTHFGSAGLEAEIMALAAWYDCANRQLHAFADKNRNLVPGPGPVYCWPHHFDIATYVSLAAGDPEHTAGVGIGMSPGDKSYGEPYFYINPWPHPDAGRLPAPPTPGHWHTEGFVGAVATASEILALEDRQAGLAAFIDQAFAIGRRAIGA